MCHASTGRFPQPLRWGGQQQLYPNQRGLQSVRPSQEKPSALVMPAVRTTPRHLFTISSHELSLLFFTNKHTIVKMHFCTYVVIHMY
ncbi:putative calcitonin gene-related peptide-like [Triplophysa rosa]|uniref:Calcitonin gene-related peptide-like n=1 Tax=Triplophysa rosa TaxID=992332 RepID=A0A9W7X0L4_TRIRA|nr:putative calcitonin gene-related peptide-like [Triplophysa rosa]